MKILVAFFITIISSIAFAAPSGASDLYGNWLLPAFTVGGVTYTTHFHFAPGEATATVECEGLNQKVSNHVTAKAVITDTQLTTSAVASPEDASSLHCNFSFIDSTVDYKISADGKYVSMGNDQATMVLTREAR